jgi:hypothetical protein
MRTEAERRFTWKIPRTTATSLGSDAEKLDCRWEKWSTEDELKMYTPRRDAKKSKGRCVYLGGVKYEIQKKRWWFSPWD